MDPTALVPAAASTFWKFTPKKALVAAGVALGLVAAGYGVNRWRKNRSRKAKAEARKGKGKKRSRKAKAELPARKRTIHAKVVARSEKSIKPEAKRSTG